MCNIKAGTASFPPYCSENKSDGNSEPEPLFAEIIADPLALVALHQFPLAKETIL